MVPTQGALAALLLAGCDDMPRARTEAEIQQIAREVNDRNTIRLEEKIEALESKVEAQRAQLLTTTSQASATVDALDSLRTTFNSNVDLDNKQAVNRMTARGACGQETYVDTYNVTRLRNKECTVKDLR